jgi:ketosteroid isomerase-like protein
MERAASQFRDGAIDTFERISEFATADLAYIVEIERTRAMMGESGDVGTMSLRVTTIFRREDDGWRIAHHTRIPAPTSARLRRFWNDSARYEGWCGGAPCEQVEGL